MENFTAIFDEVSDIVCIADAGGGLVYLNRRGRSLLGLGADEDIAARRLLDFYPEDEHAHLRDKALPAALREGAWRGRSAIVSADGGQVPVAISLLARQAVTGGPEGVVVTMQPVEDTLGHARLERLLDASRVVLYACSAADFTVTYISPNILKQFGYPAEAFLRDRNFWPDRIHPEDASQVLSDIQEHIDEGHQTHEYRFLHQDGRYRWVYDEIALVKDERGGNAELLGAFQDVTERKEAEMLVREQAAVLAQFSTPLVPISDDVLVMPLVGSLDARRVEQVIATLLDGVGHSQARVAILDITGVAVVDTHVADALLRAARAVALLGAQVVITGIRSEVAQTLVQLGANMGDVVTRATLQAGVAYAMGGRANPGAQGAGM